MKAKQQKLATRCVHSGEEKHGRSASLATDIALASVFVVPSVKALRDIIEHRSHGYYYTRDGNPTTAAAEAKIAALEGGAGGIVTASGMAAILAAVLATCKAGDQIISMLDVYGGTIKLFDSVLAPLGIETVWVPFGELDNIERYFSTDSKLLFLESPTNPTLRCADIAKLSRAAKKRGITVLVDNTFATPILQRPLELGADIVMHSATKYLGGHSDLTAGALVASEAALAERMREVSVVTGGVLDPAASYLLLRGLKTLQIRVERACRNAALIAKALARNPKVARVMYPGLPQHQGHRLARKQMSDFGMMLSIDVKGGGRAAERFIDRLKLWYLATSLGGVESTVSYPVLASHLNCTPAQLKLLEISAATVRLSIGIEDPQDLIADLEQALR
jgi:cystathionine beta-lyase/cystathionine gamma-synthase